MDLSANTGFLALRRFASSALDVHKHYPMRRAARLSQALQYLRGHLAAETLPTPHPENQATMKGVGVGTPGTLNRTLVVNNTPYMAICGQL
jgi:hypothetical protein